MTKNGEKYWIRKNSGLCVVCATPVKTGKSRCPVCMKYQSHASVKSARARFERMSGRIKELERMLSECGAESVVANESARTP